MPALLAAGSYAMAFSPALVIFFRIVARRPDLIVLTLTSGCIWILSISACGLLWVALPLQGPAMLLVLVYSVLIQELGRWCTYRLYIWACRCLQVSGLRVADPDGNASPQSAVAAGLGVTVVQVLVVYGDGFTPAALPGSLYTPTCSHLSFFAVTAISSAAVSILNILLSIMGWTVAYPRKSRPMVAALVLLHFAASAATLLNTPGALGCAASLPTLLLTVLAAAALTAQHTLFESGEAKVRPHAP